MNSKQSSPLVVGTLHSPFCLKKVEQNFKKLAQGEGIDFLEARLDLLPIEKLPTHWPLPVIATARHPKEGGENNLSLRERRQLLEHSLSWCRAIDVELRSAKQLASTIACAHAEGKFVIGSFHDFKTVPSDPRLRELVVRAREANVDILKVAVTINDEAAFLRLVEFQQLEKSFPLATMGMGEKFGKISRLILPAFGSTLAYGWLAKPQVVGQWSVEQLALLFSE
ncbi:MAG: type I 3-dehydroquinate dehydratase [Chthoniobacterales bacterium]